MKKIAYLITFLLTTNVFAFVLDPVLGFAPGYFEGEGRYMTSEGFYEEYPAFVEVQPFYWVSGASMLHRDQSFEWYFTLVDNDKFEVRLIMHDHVVTNNIKDVGETFFGEGYCVANQCDIHVDIEDGFVEERITFYPEGINKIGILHFLDENGYERFINWEENLDFYDITSL